MNPKPAFQHGTHWISLVSCLALTCSCLSSVAESLFIVEAPAKLPRNMGLGNYSPPLQIRYSGLKAGQSYTLKGWLLYPVTWVHASTQWRERQIPIDNMDGANATGILMFAEKMDVFNYESFDWVFRLYDASETEVAMTEQYADATSNLPPILGAIGSRSGEVGKEIQFNVTASDPDGNKVTWGAVNLPPGAVLDSASGKFSWVPAFGGTYKVLFYAQDNGDGKLKDAELVELSSDNTCLWITEQPRSRIVALAEPVMFSVAAQGEPAPAFQWYHGGSAITNATSSTLVLNEVKTTDEGEYSVSITSARCEAKNLAAYLTVTNLPPEVAFTFVPDFGTFDNLKGQIRHVDPEFYDVGVLIFLPGLGWYSKPTLAQPLSPINSDGTWTTDITTGGIDERATMIRALLVRKNSIFPGGVGMECLPPELEQQARASVIATRMDPRQRVLQFSGYNWAVKASTVAVGPGPNYFGDSFSNASVDDRGKLHLRITNVGGKWYCVEIVCQQSPGYGTYVFEIESSLALNENVVLGLFTWTDSCLSGLHNEIDLEFSKWGVPSEPNNAQFVVQPFGDPGHLLRFRAATNPTTHSFRWTNDSISFASLVGSYSPTPEPLNIIKQWTFSEAGAVPKPATEAPRMNLWLYNGKAPSDGKDVEIVIKRFAFIPADLPKLSIALDGKDVVLSWPAAFTSFTLFQADQLSGNWSSVQTVPVTMDNAIQVVLPITGMANYFQLRGP